MNAASQVADGRMTLAQISQSAAISSKQLDRWQKLPLFVEMVAKCRATFRNRVMNSGIALKERRIEEKVQRHTLLKHVQSSRAKLADGNPELAQQGGKTGLVIIEGTALVDEILTNTKVLPDGTKEETQHVTSRRIPKYGIDFGLMSSMSSIEREVAEEVGDLKVPGGGGNATIILQLTADEMEF
jgi:hypothetical protein